MKLVEIKLKPCRAAMGLKSRQLMRILAGFQSMPLPPMKDYGRFGGRFSLATFYSTQRVVDEYHNVGKLGLAKNLANLVEESASDCSNLEQTDTKNNDNKENRKPALAKNLASLVHESYDVHKRKPKPRTRLEAKRFLEVRIKKKVKEQFQNGKFRDLMMKVIADPNTLKDAYNCIRVTSNVNLSSVGDNLSFESMAEELATGSFDISANTYAILSRGPKVKKEKLVFPKLKLRIVQEAIRIVLEVVYRPQFSKFSHGYRSGRSHRSALKYLRKEIPDPDWWFTVVINKKADECILSKIISMMEEKIDDDGLCGIIRNMFDAGVLNLEFGSFVKGHGLPQEGVLSPILMNIYLDLFDREVYRLSMQYEVSESCRVEDQDMLQSKLRGWFRRQMNSGVGKNSIHCVRFMDEIFFAVSGPKEVALSFKSDIESFLKNYLYLEVDDRIDVLASVDSHGIQFLGTCIRRRLKETKAVRAIHKLKDKVEMFAEQREECWERGAFRIGKKWLAHGLKKVKESEIKQLAHLSPSLLQIACHRKPGMKTDHWYKELLKIWAQDVYAKRAGSEERVLIKHIVEPALPKELTDSYHEFQKQAKEYVDSETASTLALLSGDGSPPPNPVYVTEVLAPVNNILRRLSRYGLTNKEGFARASYVLILLDDGQIIDWFAGIVRRWLRFYDDCDNFVQVKQVICNEVRMSCIRTLASKYRIFEGTIAKKFDDELSRIPSTEEIELENEKFPEEDEFDGASMYGINYSGACLVSLVRVKGPSRPCSVMGCTVSVSRVYSLHVMERQRFPGWKTGFSMSLHPSLHRRRIALCGQHLKDVFLGEISLQSVQFCGGKD